MAAWQTQLAELAGAARTGAPRDIHTVMGLSDAADAAAFCEGLRDAGAAHVFDEHACASAGRLRSAARAATRAAGARDVFALLVPPRVRGRRLGEVYAAIERIADGRMPAREGGRERVDGPTVVVFSAHRPRSKFLGPSARWRMWRVEGGAPVAHARGPVSPRRI